MSTPFHACRIGLGQFAGRGLKEGAVAGAATALCSAARLRREFDSSENALYKNVYTLLANATWL